MISTLTGNPIISSQLICHRLPSAMTFPDSWFNSANSADKSTGGLPFGTSFSGIISISSIGSDCTGAIKFLLFFSINISQKSPGVSDSAAGEKKSMMKNCKKLLLLCKNLDITRLS